MKTQEIYNKAWFSLGFSKELKKGKLLQKILLETPIVLWRDEKGKAHAFLDRCPHRHMPLSTGRVKKGRLRCRYHGWAFNNTGSLIEVPGLEKGKGPSCTLKKFEIFEKEQFLWVYGDPSEKAPYGPPDLLPKNKMFRLNTKYNFEGGLFDVLENFLDPTHTHFVHKTLLRLSKTRKRISTKILHHEDGVQAVYFDEGEEANIFAKTFGKKIDKTSGRFHSPNIVVLDYLEGEKLKARIILHFTPKTSEKVEMGGSLLVKGHKFLFFPIMPFLKLMLKKLLKEDRLIIQEKYSHEKLFPTKDIYKSTEADLLGPTIKKWLLKGPRPTIKEKQREIWL